MGSTAAVTGLIGSGISAGTTAAGAYGQSQAALNQGRYGRSMANVNANMTEMAALDAERRGQFLSGRQSLRTQLLIGQQRTVAAAQGVDVNSGSALDLQADAARMGVLDRHTIKMNAYQEAMNLRMRGSNERFNGNMAYRAGRNRAFNTLLGGGMNAANQAVGALDTYYKYKPPGGLMIPSAEDEYGLDYGTK